MYEAIYVLRDDPDFVRFDCHRQDFRDPTWSWVIAGIVQITSPNLLSAASARAVLFAGEMPDGMTLIWVDPERVILEDQQILPGTPKTN